MMIENYDREMLKNFTFLSGLDLDKYEFKCKLIVEEAPSSNQKTLLNAQAIYEVESSYYKMFTLYKKEI